MHADSKSVIMFNGSKNSDSSMRLIVLLLLKKYASLTTITEKISSVGE